MIKNFKLIIEYDGTDYHGWQRQKNERTIQAEIENQLSRITQNRITLHGSGRTDAGVHALGQVANFTVETKLTAEAIQNGLNSLLPADIVICSCSLADDSFHARYDVKWKMYQYHIYQNRFPSAVGRQYVWHLKKMLGVAAMKQAAERIIGTHDFKAFEGSGSPRSSTIRTVRKAELNQHDGHLVFSIEANGFLKHMVRNIVGSLVGVGSEIFSPDDFEAILASGDRTKAGITAPPHGLFLMHVEY